MFHACKIVAAIVIVLSANLTQAASDPSDLAKIYIRAIEENNLKLYESTIYPPSLKLQKKRLGDKYNKQMDIRFARKKPSQYRSYEICIEDIKIDEDSNLEKRRLRFYKSKWAIFPLKPEKYMNIIVKDGDKSTNGEWTVPYSSQVLSRNNGQWCIILPNDIVEIE